MMPAQSYRLTTAARTRPALCRLAALSLSLLAAACTTMTPPSGTVQPAQVPAPAAATPTVNSAQADALRNLVAIQDRLYRVGAPLLVNNTELCKGNARNLLGFTAKNKYSYSQEFIEAAQAVLGLNDRLEVMDVLDGSSAAKVGVRRGDVLLSAEGKTLPQGPNAERQAAAILAPLVVGKPSVKLLIERNDAPHNITVPLTHACAFAIELGNASNINAYADGHRVLVTRGMLNFIKNDDELAYVLAKEMAHDALAHPQKLRMNATVGSIIDNLLRMRPDTSTLSGSAGIKPMPRAMDNAADALALYMLARAGYGIDAAPAFWQRLADKVPLTVLNGYNAIHTPIAERLPTIDKTIVEIKTKQLTGKPLLP